MTCYKTILQGVSGNKFLILLFFCLPLQMAAQQTMYVAVKSGVSIRNAEDSSVITTAAYGEALTVDSVAGHIWVDGFETNRVVVNYKGQKGLTIGAYLLPIPPPAKGVGDLKQYADQLSVPVCEPVHIDKENEIGTNKNDTKILYENGAIYIEYINYEYYTNSLIIPDINIQQAFIIARNIPLLKDILPVNGNFPTKNLFEKNNGDYREIQLFHNLRYNKLEKMTFAVDDINVYGAVNIIELNGQVIIIYDYSI